MWDIDHIDYVSTLKNNTGRQTPLLFLEYIIKTYPQLSMDFTPRTIMTKSLLFINSVYDDGRLIFKSERKRKYIFVF